jgi:hypothetical protein
MTEQLSGVDKVAYHLMNIALSKFNKDDLEQFKQTLISGIQAVTKDGLTIAQMRKNPPRNNPTGKETTFGQLVLIALYGLATEKNQLAKIATLPENLYTLIEDYLAENDHRKIILDYIEDQL